MSAAHLLLLALAGAAPIQGTSPESGLEPPVTTIVAADARFAALRQALIDKVRAGTIPSIAIAVAEGGRTVWEEAIGWADREQGITASPEASYALGSLSKSLASAAVLTLVDAGLIGLDEPLSRWLVLSAPTGVKSQPTLRQLLDASAGIPHGWHTIDPGDAPTTAADWDAWLASDAFLAFPPGVVFEYSNNSFGVAARVAERVADQPFAGLILARLFAPLGMDSSGTVPLASTAVRYSTTGAPLARKASVPDAGLGMVASAADLVRFGNFVRGHSQGPGAPPLSPSAVAMLWRPAVGPSREFFHFGFWNGGRTLVTTGNIEGANAHLSIGRDADVVVAVTVNQTGSAADEAAGGILDLLLPTVAEAPDIRESYDALYRLPFRTPPAFAGRWRGSALVDGTPVPLMAEARGDSLLMRLGSADWVPVARPRMSVYGEFRGSLPLSVSGGDASVSESARLDVVLLWEDDLLRGYLLPRDSSARPIAVRLERDGS